jgi:hypothetical protein
MLRIFCSSLLAGLLTVTVYSATSHAGDNDCTIAKKDDNPVGKACKDGGIKKAKSVMKAMQKKGKEGGLKYECDECHQDESANNWKLKDGAEKKFKELLGKQ